MFKFKIVKMRINYKVLMNYYLMLNKIYQIIILLKVKKKMY